MAKASRFTNGIILRDGRPNAAASSTSETKIRSIRYYTSSINPASVAANTTAEQTFTVTGLAAGDIVLAVNKPTATAGLGMCNFRVSAANTLAITFNNNTAAPIDAAAETYSIVVMTADVNA